MSILTAKDIIDRTALKFEVPKALAAKLLSDMLEEKVKVDAEKYLLKAELFEVPFKVLLRLREETIDIVTPKVAPIPPGTKK